MPLFTLAALGLVKGIAQNVKEIVVSSLYSGCTASIVNILQPTVANGITAVGAGVFVWPALAHAVLAGGASVAVNDVDDRFFMRSVSMSYATLSSRRPSWAGQKL